MRLKPRLKKDNPKLKTRYSERAEEISEKLQKRKPIKRTRFNIEKQKENHEVRKRCATLLPGEKRFLSSVNPIDLTITITVRTEIDPKDYPDQLSPKGIYKYIETEEWFDILTDKNRDSYVEVKAEGETLN